jgi:hypothetical protein
MIQINPNNGFDRESGESPEQSRYREQIYCESGTNFAFGRKKATHYGLSGFSMLYSVF